MIFKSSKGYGECPKLGIWICKILDQDFESGTIGALFSQPRMRLCLESKNITCTWQARFQRINISVKLFFIFLGGKHRLPGNKSETCPRNAACTLSEYQRCDFISLVIS